jgi:hypothetical protein
MTLFALFPAGLKQSDNAVNDTHLGLFGGRVMDGFRANAFEITDWKVWTNMASFCAAVSDANLMIEGHPIKGDGVQHSIPDVINADKGLGVTYKLNIGEVFGHTDLRSANLQVCLGPTWVAKEVQWYYTEVCYMGQP